SDSRYATQSPTTGVSSSPVAAASHALLGPFGLQRSTRPRSTPTTRAGVTLPSPSAASSALHFSSQPSPTKSSTVSPGRHPCPRRACRNAGSSGSSPHPRLRRSPPSQSERHAENEVLGDRKNTLSASTPSAMKHLLTFRALATEQTLNDAPRPHPVKSRPTKQREGCPASEASPR